MAKISNVDYLAIPKNAKQMRQYGQSLNKEVSEAYGEIKEMRVFWYGKRYDTLVEKFNNIIPNLNEMIKLVVTDIPYTLEVIANNYSNADRGCNATAAQQTAISKIVAIEPSKEQKMRFKTEEVTGVQTKVNNKLKKSLDYMNKFESEYGKVDWESEASQAFKAKFTKLKKQITKSFEEIKSDFAKLMEQTKNDIQNTENSNTVK